MEIVGRMERGAANAPTMLLWFEPIMYNDCCLSLLALARILLLLYSDDDNDIRAPTIA